MNRAPAGWHKWTFDFDPEEGLQVLHNDKEVNADRFRQDRLEGFSAIAIWGDNGKGNEQTIWVADLSVTLGGPVKVVPASEADPYDDKAVAADAAAQPARRHLHQGQRPADAEARGPAAQGERLAVRHHLDVRASRPASASSSTATGTSSAR